MTLPTLPSLHRTVPIVFFLFVSAAHHCFGQEIDKSNAERPPNVVIIFIDDLGYADICPFGATAYKTPHLHRMAAEGRIFTDFHSATAVCSASRAALMTGCYPERVSILGALNPHAKHGINADEVTLAELCAWGIPMVLVPLPTAAADHQTSNARALERAGAALFLRQSELSAVGELFF